MRRSKVLSTITATALIVAMLAGCGKKDPVKPVDSDPKTPDKEVEEQTGDVEREYDYNYSGVKGPTGLEFGGGTGQEDFSPMTLTMYEEAMRDAVSQTDFKGEIMKQITADTGITLKTNFGVGDVTEPITLMIADRSYPDFVFSRANSAKFLEAEAFIDLAPLIDQYGPNIKKLYGKSFDSHYNEDGKIFYLGQDFVNNLPLDPEYGFQLQLALLEDQGYPEIKTLDQYADAIRKYKEKYPTIDGQETIGITLTCGDGWRWYITLGNPAGFATGCPSDGQYYVDPETMETTYRFLLPEHREYYRWLNGLYNEGLLDPDSFTQTHDEYLTKISTGRVLGLMDADWEFEEAESILVADGKGERTYGFFPATLSEDIKYPAYREEVYLASNGVGITDNCKDPVRAIQFLDYLARVEIQVMTNWGFEGVHWEIKDGARVFTESELEKRKVNGQQRTIETGMGLLSYPYPCYGSGVNDEDGYAIMPYTQQSVIDQYGDEEKKALEAYGVDMWRDLYPQADEFYFPPWGAAWYIADAVPADSELGVIQARCNDITATELMKAVTASEGDFDAIYDGFIKKLEAEDTDRLSELMTELVKKRAAWYTE